MEKHLRAAEVLTKLLEKQFGIGRFRFGLDPLLGLLPGLGDVIALLISLYLVWIGIKMRIPDKHIARMVRNVMFDFLIGLIPFFGDLSDFVYKANSRNLKILHEYKDKVIVEAEILEQRLAA